MRTNRTTRAIGATTLGLALAFGAAACGNDTTDSTSSASQPSSTDHNDADVAFATDMLPHHAQALTMVEMTQGRPLDPAVRQLADEIKAAQAPEIDTMSGWLADWDEKVPDTSGSMTSDDMNGMTGMMSADDMSSLDSASDTDFQTMWLQLMVQHHEGAVEMARTEVADGSYQPAIDLAKSIIASQSKEIATMKDLLG